MLLALLCACLFVRRKERPPVKMILLALLALFCILCFFATDCALRTFFGMSTMFLSCIQYFAFWLCLALIPAWRIISELLAFRFAKPSHEP